MEILEEQTISWRIACKDTVQIYDYRYVTKISNSKMPGQFGYNIIMIYQEFILWLSRKDCLFSSASLVEDQENQIYGLIIHSISEMRANIFE